MREKTNVKDKKENQTSRKLDVINKQLDDYLLENNKYIKNTCLIINKYNPLDMKITENGPKVSYKINKTNLAKTCNEKVGKSENLKRIFESLEQKKSDIKQNIEYTHTWIDFEANVLDKLVVGFGDVTTDETAITLHHIYGIPYIPGSAIKGVLKNYIIEKYFSQDLIDIRNIPKEDIKIYEKKKRDLESKLNNNDVLRCVFGAKAKDNNVQGQVLFFDAYPQNEVELDVDIMTPHHTDYYSKNRFPLDNDKVTPIDFYVVKNGTKFIFNIAISKEIEKTDLIIDDKNILKKDLEKGIMNFITQNFKETLECHGIGAKTAVGYGYFEENSIKR